MRDYTQIDLRHSVCNSADQESQAIEDDETDDYAARWLAAYGKRFDELVGVPYWMANGRASQYADNHWRDFE